MVYLLPTKKEILIWDKQNLIIGNGNGNIPEPTYRIKRPFSFWKYRNLRNRSIIVGYVGARGSGKSVGAARTVILDYMLRGRKVWSNMEIGFNLISKGQIIPVKSQPLDKLSLVDLDEVYSNGVIYVDEVNLLVESRRAMSHENLAFSYVLQQLRKRRLSIIWSAQSENHCEERLRFQTDIFILCEDVSISKPNCDIGAYSRWKAHDFSGIVKGRTFPNSDENVFYRGTMWNKPWWNTFDTWQLQEAGAGKSKEQEEVQSEAKRLADEISDYIKDNEIFKISKNEIWKRWKITNHKTQIQVGILLPSYGIFKSEDRRSYIRNEDELVGAGV